MGAAGFATGLGLGELIESYAGLSLSADAIAVYAAATPEVPPGLVHVQT